MQQSWASSRAESLAAIVPAIRGFAIEKKRPHEGTNGALSLKVGKKSLTTDLAGIGLTNRTTASSGETLLFSAAIGLRTGGKKYVYSASTTLLYKGTQGKSDKAATARVR